MILLADSGSTKTSWLLCGEGGVVWSAQTIGLNPSSVGAEQMGEAMAAAASDMRQYARRLEAIYFYGAGCAQPSARRLVGDMLCRHFAAQHVEVESDMIGACRAVLGRRDGIVGILGTGSNVCYYRDGGIEYCPPSLGYMLDDEGSGTVIGKRLLCDYLRGRMPQEMAQQFAATFANIGSEYRDAIYGRPGGNRYIASVASFAIDRWDNPYVEDLLLTAFRQYMQYPVAEVFKRSGLGVREMHLVGGVAAVFEPTLRKAAAIEGYSIAQIMQNPIDGLAIYHTQNIQN